MSTEPNRIPCPSCGEMIAESAVKCRFCGEFLGDDGERDMLQPRREKPMQATELLIPTNVSPWSIGACYFGLVGMCVPFAGLLFAIPGLILAILAFRNRSKRKDYGAVTSDLRAIIGVTLSSL